MVDPVAVIAPHGRDAQVIEQILGADGIVCQSVRFHEVLEGIVDARFSAAIVTEEAVPEDHADVMVDAMKGQPLWSDFPFVVLTRRGRTQLPNPTRQAMQNVTDIERPVHPETLLTAVRSAMRARARQHETRTHLAARHAAETELLRLTQSLDRRVQERTGKLNETYDLLQVQIAERIEAEARVRQIQAQLIHVARLSAMDTMASTLAHELNQPLAAIVSYMRGAERLLQSMPEVPADLITSVAAAAGNAHRAGTIIRRVRDLVAHRAIAHRPEFLRNLIEEAQVLGLIDSESRGVSCRLDISHDADRALVDRVQMQQVLINLIRNAVEAMEACPRREILISSVRIGTDKIEMTIADTGPGLPEAVLQTLFSPFKTTKAGGLGLGLSICRTIVEDHGGSITGANGAEGGAIIRVVLPRPATGT